MPIYEYRCDNCGHELETIQKVSEEPLKTCPACEQDALRKRVSAAAFRLKGGGWYETDFKSDKKRNVAGDDKADGAKAAKESAESAKSGKDGGDKGSSDGAGSSKSGDGAERKSAGDSGKSSSEGKGTSSEGKGTGSTPKTKAAD